MVSLLAAIALAPTDFRLHSREGSYLAITHTTVIDGNGGAPLRDRTVLIRGNVIVDVGSSVAIPKSTKVVDGHGKFVLPGLWDMHTHVDDPELLELNPRAEEKEQWLPLFVLNGVTGIREMAGNLKLVQSWEHRIADGKLFGPRIWCGGPLVDGPTPMWPESIAVSSPEEGRKAVRDLKAQGADFIKAYSLLQRDSFLAICDEAKKQGIPVCGHVPTSISNLDACRAGLNSIEHLLQLERELIDKPKADALKSKIEPGISREARFRAIAEANAASYSPEAAATLFSEYKRLGVWIDPTLVVSYENAFYDPKNAEMAARSRYIPAYVREWWSPELNVHFKNQSPDIRLGQQTIHKVRVRMIADLNKAGVPLLTGSDMGGNPHCFAGWGVLDELDQLVAAGLTPMEAIVAATSNPAKYLRIYEKIGSIEKGKLADLIMLDADPTVDIRNTRKLHLVIRDGQLLNRNSLDKMLKDQQTAVQKRIPLQ